MRTFKNQMQAFAIKQLLKYVEKELEVNTAKMLKPENVDELTGKCTYKAVNWGVVADKIWYEKNRIIEEKVVNESSRDNERFQKERKTREAEQAQRDKERERIEQQREREEWEREKEREKVKKEEKALTL